MEYLKLADGGVLGVPVRGLQYAYRTPDGLLKVKVGGDMFTVNDSEENAEAILNLLSEKPPEIDTGEIMDRFESGLVAEVEKKLEDLDKSIDVAQSDGWREETW